MSPVRLVAAGMLLAALPVLAAPSTRVAVQKSGVLIIASNPDDRSYNCSISFTWSHNDFGTRKSQSVNTVAGVGPKVNDVVIYNLSGAWVDVQIEGGVNISCT
ncbi:hypothetical protein [Roseateles sp.]|uniref:hypothetical protein n=1 Tax=Roseateles sp. TaxID=1971397 RepID=UPI0031E2C10A